VPGNAENGIFNFRIPKPPVRLFFANRDSIALKKKPFLHFFAKNAIFFNNSAAKVVKNVRGGPSFRKTGCAGQKFIFFYHFFAGFYSRTGQFFRRSVF